MAKSYDEDLFKNSTMTFGEHLDELRGALMKSVVALGIGLLVGLAVGKYAMRFIQSPLENSLATYYANDAVAKYGAWAEERKSQGHEVPYTQETVETLVSEYDLLCDIIYCHPWQVTRELSSQGILPRAAASEPSASAAPPAAGAAAPSAPGSSGEAAEPRGVDVVANVDVPADTFDSVGHTDERASDPHAALTVSNLTPVIWWRPVAQDGRIRATSLGVTETFTVYIKASLVVGALLSGPFIFYYIWSFVAAGLYPHEKKYVYVFLPFSVGLFFLGAAVTFLFVFDKVLDFLLSFNAWLGIDPDPRINEWLGFVLILPLGFGISFQLPLVMLFLERIGVFSVAAYTEKWRVAVLVIFVLSAILTPADPYSLLLMAVPLTALYFGGIFLCRMWPRPEQPFGT